MADTPDALDLHAIGRLVLSAGIGPRWDLSALARNGKVRVLACDVERHVETLELWSDRGDSTGGTRVVAERFIRELEALGFRITRER